MTTDQRTITNPELLFIGGQYASDATGVDHDLDKLEVLDKALHVSFGDRLPPQTLSGVASLALPGMLFEVDAVAVRP